MNYCESLWNVSAECLDRIVFTEVESDTAVTYQELKGHIRQWANFFLQQGIQPGDVVCLHIYNSLPFVYAHMAAQYIGAVSCMLDPLAQPKSLPYHIQQTQSRLLLTHSPQVLQEVSGLCTTMLVSDVEKQTIQLDSAEVSVPMYDWDKKSTSYIYYTSGTTSLPKGVPLTYSNHENFFKIAETFWKPSDSSSKHICFVPFSHGFGSVFLIPWTIRTESETFIMRSFQPLKVEELIRTQGVTHIYGVPSHYQQLLKFPQFHASLRHLQMAFCAAAKLDQGIMDAWKQVTGNPLHEGYGLIETTGGIVWRVHQSPLQTGHVGGCPSRDLIEVEIMDEKDSIVSPGTEGEIVVRGKSVTQGYLKMPEENAKIFRGGWFHTGDKGFITEDRQLVMTGRIKDIINIAGIKISPYEVETVLNSHDQVENSVVVSAEDHLYGEVVKAFVVLKSGALCSERDLIKFASQHLINFQVPKMIVFVGDFPKNNMGKVDRKQLRSL